MAVAADGDLTQRLDEDVDNEALAEIATAFNEMVAELERTIVDIQALAEDVDDVSVDVTGRVEEIEKAGGEVSRSSEEIATAAAEQSDRFQEVYGEMNDPRRPSRRSLRPPTTSRPSPVTPRIRLPWPATRPTRSKTRWIDSRAAPRRSPSRSNGSIRR